MKPAPFDYVKVTAGQQALQILAEVGDDGQILAGGQSLMAMLNMRLLSPQVVIDISRASELKSIGSDEDWLEVGAATTQAALMNHPGLAMQCPLLAKALPYVGHYQTRSRGTVCGSLCHADPSSELPLVLATLGGQVVLQSAARERVLDACDFQTGMLSTACEDDELMHTSRWPLAQPGAGYAFREVSMRRGDFAIVAIAAVAGAHGLTLGVGGVADGPAVVNWPMLDSGETDDALNDLAWSLPADSDAHASARYRRDLVRRVGRQVIEEAQRCRA